MFAEYNGDFILTPFLKIFSLYFLDYTAFLDFSQHGVHYLETLLRSNKQETTHVRKTVLCLNRWFKLKSCGVFTSRLMLIV